jgi:hypothetical protein
MKMPTNKTRLDVPVKAVISRHRPRAVLARNKRRASSFREAKPLSPSSRRPYASPLKTISNERLTFRPVNPDVVSLVAVAFGEGAENARVRLQPMCPAITHPVEARSSLSLCSETSALRKTDAFSGCCFETAAPRVFSTPIVRRHDCINDVTPNVDATPRAQQQTCLSPPDLINVKRCVYEDISDEHLPVKIIFPFF